MTAEKVVDKMDSQLLSGSYKRYKEDTTAFCTWLCEKAATCGYRHKTKSATAPAHNSSDHDVLVTLGERLREKAAKKAMKREAKITNLTESSSTPIVKITTSTRDLLLQAKAVARSGIVEVPTAIVQVLERAIQVRKRCVELFQLSTSEDSQSTSRHVHFIRILEEISEILAPRIKQAPENLDQDIGDSISDISEDRLDETSENQTTNSSSADNTDGVEGEVHVDLEEDETTNAFAVFCFFEDMHKIEDYMKIIWEECKEGKLNAITASFITNAAIDIVRTQEIELSDSVRPGKPLCYEGLVTIIVDVIMQCKEVAKDFAHFDEVAKLKLSRGESLLDNLHEYTANLPTESSSYTQDEKDSDEIHQNDPVSAKHQSQTPHIEEKRLNGGNKSYILSRIEQLDPDELFYRWPACIQSKNHQVWSEGGQSLNREQFAWGTITSLTMYFDMNRADLSIMPEWKRILKDDYLLTEMASEALTHYGFLEYATVGKFPLRSVALSPRLIPDPYVEEVWHCREVSTYFVFASQILLDINAILGDQAKKVIEELETYMDKCEASLPIRDTKMGLQIVGELTTEEEGMKIAQLSKEIRTAVTRHWKIEKPVWMQKFKEAFVESGFQYQNIADDSKDEFWENWRKSRASEDSSSWESAPIIDPGPGKEENLFSKHTHVMRDEPFFFAHNPPNCGTRLLEISLSMETSGLAIANAHHSILGMAHLYNAVRQMGILKTRWPEMDRMIDLHLSTLFRGSLPTQKFVKRLCVAYGIKPSSFAIYKRTRKWEADRHDATYGPKLLCTKTSSILLKLRDESNPITLQQCLYQISILISESNGKSKKPNRSELNPLQLLSQIRDWFPTFVQEMQTDYIGLSRTCSSLWWRIRMTILVQLKITHPTHNSPADKRPEPGLLQMTFDILRELDKYAAEENILGVGGPQLQIVGDVLRKFLEAK